MADRSIEAQTVATEVVGPNPRTGPDRSVGGADNVPVPNSGDSGRFRRDIEGMRAVAVLVIVAYHAGVPGFSGGFVGVDVFFVISGYLITGIVVDAAGRHDTGGLAGFWARRVRRLVPGLGLMVAVTLVASALIVAPFDMLELAKEGAASALYFSNILFATTAQNYFASNINKSPFLHTWSLGVEEQFYLVWPLLLLGAIVLGRRMKSLALRRAGPLLVVILVASFLLNLRWTADNGTWAFFSLPTRAWEFAAGGLLASVRIKQVPRWWGGLLGWVGLALVTFATVRFTEFTTYPGVNAVVPVAGTVLLVLSGAMVARDEPTVVMQGLSVPPMQWLGKLSYSWYLWHWPFIVLTVLALHNDGTPLKTAAAAILARRRLCGLPGRREPDSPQPVTHPIVEEDLSPWPGHHGGRLWRRRGRVGRRLTQHAHIVYAGPGGGVQGLLSPLCRRGDPRGVEVLRRWGPGEPDGRGARG